MCLGTYRCQMNKLNPMDLVMVITKMTIGEQVKKKNQKKCLPSQEKANTNSAFVMRDEDNK